MTNEPNPATDPAAQRMTFWRNNRLDASFTKPLGEVAGQFLASRWADVDCRTDRAVAAFLSDSDGPISAVWDDAGQFDQLVELINEHRRTAR